MGKKIVLDTNIFISAFGWQGAPNEIFLKCLSGDLDLFISPHLLFELKKVLAYPKFDFNSDEIQEFLSIVAEVAEIVEPNIVLDIISEDPSDNRILECAVISDCEYIISGDKHLLDLKEFQGINILSPHEFLSLTGIIS